MKLIDRNDIETWAGRFDSKGLFPVLISKLVRATTPQSTFAEFPSGSAVYVGGWDGMVNCKEDTSYVPNGISLWEFGTEAGNNAKAEDDYAKRTADPQGYNSKECTFIFATPTFWRGKDKWKKEKLAEGKWLDIRTYDSRNLEEWLDIAPAVVRTFSSYVGKYPIDGTLLTEIFWEEWSIGPSGTLPPESVTSGREKESKELLDYLCNPAAIKAVRAFSKDEAIAFIIASAKQFEPQYKDNFFSKSLIVDTANSFRNICSGQNKLILISKIEEMAPLYRGASQGHHILVPLGADDKYNSGDIITLPRLGREGLIDSLVKMGLSKDDAANYSKESSRDITILKRLLKWPQDKLEWAKPENAREVIPALLLGKWDESKKGDIEIIEGLSGEKYDDYIIKVSKWRDSENPLFLQIGTSWRLISPMDAWANLAPFLVKSDFEKLERSFINILKGGNPIIEPPKGKAILAFFSKEYFYSHWSREGLTQSLILIALYGENLSIPSFPAPQLWVDGIIKFLLAEASGQLWISLHNEMPLIAEASPISFLNALDESLSKVDKPILEMFKEEKGFISSSSAHTGLLWALEALAWDPEYFAHATLLLSKFAALDPGGQLANRPINSLHEIFKPWHYQTLSSFKERIDALNLIAKKEKEIAWIVLSQMLPNGHDTGQYTHRMRWRIFDRSLERNYTWKEIWDTHSAVIDILLSIFDFSEEKLSKLIQESTSTQLQPKERDRILTFIELNYDKVNQANYTAWHTLRGVLHHHRSHPTAKWVLSDIELSRYEKIYLAKQPKDTIQRTLWMFNEQWPNFPEGYRHGEKSMEEQQKIIDSRRIDALKEIYNMVGVEGIKNLSVKIEYPHFLGDTLAYFLENESEIIFICNCLNQSQHELKFIQGFIFRKSIIKGGDWVFELFEKLKQLNFSNASLGQFLIPLNQTKELWNFIESTNEEIRKEYWLNIYPSFFNADTDEKILGLTRLIEYKRYYSAIQFCQYNKGIPSSLIIDLLEKTATEKPNEKVRLQDYYIIHLFEELDKRNDVDIKTLIQLEWYFTPFLASYGTNRSPKLLHKELSDNPQFFIDVLKGTYKSKDEAISQKEREGLTDEQIQTRGRHGFDLLNSWKKIPGVDEASNIDINALWAWINTVRKLAEESGRLDVADMHIGKVLAEYPEAIPNWPPNEICEILETVNTKSILNNFSSALFNKRGSSTRGPFDGGAIEKGHAKYFYELSDKIKLTFPKISTLFKQLAMGYEYDAKQQDERAERDKLEY
jgi:hypothetical protein